MERLKPYHGDRASGCGVRDVHKDQSNQDDDYFEFDDEMEPKGLCGLRIYCRDRDFFDWHPPRSSNGVQKEIMGIIHLGAYVFALFFLLPTFTVKQVTNIPTYDPFSVK